MGLEKVAPKIREVVEICYVLACRFGCHYLFLYVDLDGMSYMFMA